MVLSLNLRIVGDVPAYVYLPTLAREHGDEHKAFCLSLYITRGSGADMFFTCFRKRVCEGLAPRA